MPTRVETTPDFEKELDRLGRKYPAVFDVTANLITMLERDERPGAKVSGVGYDVYKIRLPNPSARRGKRGGLRVILYLRTRTRVILISIYSKTESPDISNTRIRRLLDSLE